MEEKTEASGNVSDRAAQRAAVLAEMETGATSEPEVIAAPAAAEPEPAEAKSEEPAAAEADVESSEATTETESAEAVTDPETAKRLSQVQKAERRSRDLLAKERADLVQLKAEIEKQRQEMAAQLEEVKSFSSLKSRARYAPAEVLAALGLTDDDFEPAARDLYTRSRAGLQDPKNREAAARMQAQREHQDKVSQLEQRLAEFEKRDQQRQQEAQYQAAWQSYWGDVVKTASGETAETPLLKSALTKNPTRAQRDIQAVAAQLFEASGEWPDVADVTSAYEKQRRQELEELGVDLTPKTSEAEKRTSKTLSPGRAAGTPTKAPKNRKEERADVLAALESGRLD